MGSSSLLSWLRRGRRSGMRNYLLFPLFGISRDLRFAVDLLLMIEIVS
ncbi:MAG: hypothetical protein K8F29_07055 [Kofleriaceae bacterium]|nr:hypothetical protein [Candidatus Methylomirabilis lanthanidiphila]